MMHQQMRFILSRLSLSYHLLLWQAKTAYTELALYHPPIRNFMVMLEKYLQQPCLKKKEAVFMVDLEGNPLGTLLRS